jgi:GNAT superfamily N-acetyltransferase
MLIERLADDGFDVAVPGLTEVLIDCTDGGASVGFLLPLGPQEARAFWIDALGGPGHTTWVARDHDGRIVGCVQLRRAMLPNSAHRAEVGKLLVHRRARGRGVARALMAELEHTARAEGLTLLLLDTETGSPAEGLYRSLGWQVIGVVRDHAALPSGQLAPTTFLSRHLG